MTRPSRRGKSTPHHEVTVPQEDSVTMNAYAPDVLETTRLTTPRALRPLSPVPTVAGVVAVALGLVLIAVAWGGVAGEPEVNRQIPYLVSGGIFGLAVVLIGLTVINVASRRREIALREQHTQLLADAVEQLGVVLHESPGRS